MATGNQIVEAARAYIGTPYLHAGRNPWGLDCVGLLIAVGHDLELLPRWYAHTGYGRVVNPEVLAREIGQFCDLVPFEERAPGDILIISVRGSAQHTAILSEIGESARIIHACTSLKKVAEQRLDSDLYARITAVYRFKVKADFRSWCPGIHVTQGS